MIPRLGKAWCCEWDMRDAVSWIYTRTLSLPFSLPHTPSLSHTHKHTHTQTHAHTHTQTHTHTRAFCAVTIWCRNFVGCNVVDRLLNNYDEKYNKKYILITKTPKTTPTPTIHTKTLRYLTSGKPEAKVCERGVGQRGIFATAVRGPGHKNSQESSHIDCI